MISAKEARQMTYGNQMKNESEAIEELIIKAAKEGKAQITLHYIPCKPVLELLNELGFCYVLMNYQNECVISW